MLKVECESCKAPYQVDERRVPPTGLKMRCPKCGHTFLVTDPSKGGAAAAPAGGPGAPPAERPKMKQTMVGVGAVGAGAKGPPMPAKPIAPPPPVAAPPPIDDGLALPAVRSAPRVQARTAPIAAAPAAPPPAFGSLPGLGDLDLPSVAGDVGLPAAVNRKPPARIPTAAAMPIPPMPAPPPQAPGFSFEVDLPAVQGHGGGFGQVDLPSPKGGAFGSVDLPSPKGGAFGSVDLPSPKLGGADLPLAKGTGAFGSIDLPSPRGPGGFADLPALQNDLPLVGGHNNLPMPSMANNLPAAFGNLPMVGGNLPVARSGGFGEIDLPSLQNDLPNAMGLQAHMPMPVSDDRLLPNRPGGQPPPIAFGELDLPVVGGAPQASRPPEAMSFGELDLPPDPTLGAPPMSNRPQAPPNNGGMAFGEVDLGGGHDGGGPVMGPPPAASAGSMFEEASLDERPQGPATGTRQTKRQTYHDRPSSKAPKIIGAVIALLVVGGAALQLTPVGAFGHTLIGDKLHASDYDKDALKASDDARAKLALDTYSSAQQAADDLAELKRRSPRNRPLASYAAYAEYMNELRFGIDPTRAGRAKTFLSDIPPNTEVHYLTAAQAAQDAASGDFQGAKSVLSNPKEPKDAIQYDMLILRGEIALAERDNAQALASYGEALKTAATARSQFGLARAHYAMKNLPKAKAAVDATLQASPSHAGGHTMRAQLLWELQRDDVAALKELGIVLDDNARKTEGPNEVSTALAAKGWIMLARDRAGDARAAFDEAVKIDPRNVTALVGQGEVLYADGRYTEALTRFDEAVTKDPVGIAPTLGDAKTKIALERLADAKAQLTAAKARAPKDMGVTLWLAKAEEALGNKSVAEKLYNESLDLADPANPDAIDAYAAIASFLASQGRPQEAQQKLDQARSKLPDTAVLQRSFGDVAEAQGHFEEALGHYQQALSKSPNDLGTRFRLGKTYRKMNKLDDAAKEFDTIVATDKEYPNIAVERGLLFEKSGDVQKALEQFQNALDKTPKDVDLQLRVGAAYVSIGEVDKALPLLNKVKDQRPNSAEANHFIGRAYLRKGGIEGNSAMRYLQRAVELDPNRAEYHLYVAWAANEAMPAQLGLARTEVDKALSLDRLLADGYWQRGVVSLREGAVNDAIKDLKHALELKPSRFEAHAALAECDEQKNDLAGAMGEWSKAISGDDKVAVWRYHYGRLLLDKNQAGEAAKHLAFALDDGKKQQPRPGWIARCAFEAGEALRKTGQKAQAVEAYQFYFDVAPSADPDRKDALRGLTAVGGQLDR